MARKNCLAMFSLRQTQLYTNHHSQCCVGDYCFSLQRHWRTDRMAYTIRNDNWSIKFTDQMICEISLHKNYKTYDLYHWKQDDTPITPDKIIEILNSDWNKLPALMAAYDAAFTASIEAYEKRQDELAIFR